MEQIPIWLSYTQIGSSIFLGLSALIVAGLSLRWSYRNNFGWKPVAIIKDFKIAHVTHRGNETALCHHGELELEFWNRRKYPVVIRVVQIDLPGVVLRQGTNGGPSWVTEGTTMRRVEDMKVEPTSHKKYVVRIPYLVETAGEVQTAMSIGIRYYDPRSNREGQVRIQARHSFTAGQMTKAGASTVLDSAS